MRGLLRRPDLVFYALSFLTSISTIFSISGLHFPWSNVKYKYNVTVSGETLQHEANLKMGLTSAKLCGDFGCIFSNKDVTCSRVGEGIFVFLLLTLLLQLTTVLMKWISSRMYRSENFNPIFVTTATLLSFITPLTSVIIWKLACQTKSRAIFFELISKAETPFVFFDLTHSLGISTGWWLSLLSCIFAFFTSCVLIAAASTEYRYDPIAPP